MPQYNVALIRFHQNGRHYPVNCALSVKPGDEVMVRMAAQAPALQKAEVVSTTSYRKPCKNSVVCRADQAEAYGAGPYGVETLEDFERYVGFYSLVPYSTLCTVGGGEQPFEKWPTAYAPRYWQTQTYVRGPIYIYLVGPEGLGRRYLSEDTLRKIKDGKLVLSSLDFISKFKDENPYREAAFFIDQEYLIEDLDPPSDNSISEIRSAINGGGGGAAYLSDDVWI